LKENDSPEVKEKRAVCGAGARRAHLTKARAGPYDSQTGGAPTPRIVPRTKWPSAVVDLADARDDRRLREYQARLRAVLETNRKALSRLFQSGLIFTRAGARLGRDLLLAHQHLLKVADLLARLGELSSRGARNRRDAEAEALYAQVQALLARTSELSARSDGLLARER
jgi:hypothetical protein